MWERTKKILKICGLTLLVLLVSILYYRIFHYFINVYPLILVLCIILPIFLIKLSMKHICYVFIVLLFMAFLVLFLMSDKNVYCACACETSLCKAFSVYLTKFSPPIFNYKILYFYIPFAYISLLMGIKGYAISNQKLFIWGKLGFYFPMIILFVHEIVYNQKERTFFLIISTITILGILYFFNKKHLKSFIIYACALPMIVYGVWVNIFKYKESTYPAFEYFYTSQLCEDSYSDELGCNVIFETDSLEQRKEKEKIINQIITSCVPKHIRSHRFMTQFSRYIYAQNIADCVIKKIHNVFAEDIKSKEAILKEEDAAN